MTSGFFSRRLALLAAVSASLLMAACGGGDDDNGGGSTNMRAINLTTDLSSLDLYTGSTKRFTALAQDTMAPSVAFEAGTHVMAVKRANENGTLHSESFSLAKDAHFATVIVGQESSLIIRAIPEDENTNNITAGNARVRVFNLTSDVDGVDVFITADNIEIGRRQPDARFTTNTLSDFLERATGTYRLRVTTQGVPSEVRLDIPLTLGDKNFHTLVLTPGPSGELINATLIPQGGTPAILKNTKARVRVAAGVENAGNVTVSVGGATLLGTLRSPSISAYVPVSSGSQEMTLRINGAVVSTGNRSFVPGGDYTVVVYGTAGASQLLMLNDDNRRPVSAGRATVRLVNAVAGSEPMTMQLDRLPLVYDIAPGTASNYITVTSAGSKDLSVSTLSASAPLFNVTADAGTSLLSASGIYTVFMLSGATTGGVPVSSGELRKDR